MVNPFDFRGEFLYSGTRMLLAEERKRGRNATAAKSLK